MPPGVGRGMVGPGKSAIVSLPTRARATMSSYASRKPRKSSDSHFRIAATTRERPDLVFMSIARPRLIPVGVTVFGLPSISSKWLFMLG